MIKEAQLGPEQQQIPVDPSDISPEYSTLTFFKNIDDMTDTDVPSAITVNGETKSVVNRHGEQYIRPVKFVVAEVFSSTWPFLGDHTRPLPDLTARLTVYDTLGGEKKVNSRGQTSTTGSIESIEITIHDGSVTLITTDSKRTPIQPSKALSVLEAFYAKYRISPVDHVHPVNYEYEDETNARGRG